MHLIADIGNSRVKVAGFKDGNLIDLIVREELNVEWITEWIGQYPDIHDGIVSTVGRLDPVWSKFLQERFPGLIILNERTPIPVINRYETPETLGKDRLAGVVGAYNIHKGSDVLVIDYGTAVTYDFLSAAGEYLGGNISPGLQTRFRALNHFTARLPLVEPAYDFHETGLNTEKAIRAGVMKGILYETEGYIQRFRKENVHGVVVMTGGDAGYFDGLIKPPIFVDGNLVLKGLNAILEYNIKRNSIHEDQ